MPRTTDEAPGFPLEIPVAPNLESLREVMVRCTRCPLAASRTPGRPGRRSGAGEGHAGGRSAGRQRG
jgi:hypothetical protein